MVAATIFIFYAEKTEFWTKPSAELLLSHRDIWERRRSPAFLALISTSKSWPRFLPTVTVRVLFISFVQSVPAFNEIKIISWLAPRKTSHSKRVNTWADIVMFGLSVVRIPASMSWLGDWYPGYSARKTPMPPLAWESLPRPPSPPAAKMASSSACVSYAPKDARYERSGQANDETGQWGPRKSAAPCNRRAVASRW